MSFLERHKILLLFGLAALFLVVGIGYFIPMDTMKEKVTQFNIWVESLGYLGPLVLAAVDTIAIVLCFPFTLGFELAAGFLFGLLPGYARGRISSAPLHVIKISHYFTNVKDINHIYCKSFWSADSIHDGPNRPQIVGRADDCDQ